MRISSIDIFRALTMVLMIFVNDLWSLTDIPGWLEHSAANVDFLGLADVVFPCFLVVMGMAIPFAIQNRLAKKESNFTISKHIIFRSVALLIMGVFTVEIPDLNPKFTGLSEALYALIMVIAFFMIWNVYPNTQGRNRLIYRSLQIVGMVVLIWLAIIYRGNPDGQSQVVGFRTQWWGILGLIGWSYLACALIYLFGRNKPFVVITVAWMFFTLFSIAGHAGWLHRIWPDGPREWFVGNGAFHSFTLAGVIGGILLQKYAKPLQLGKILTWFVSLGLVMLAAGLIARHFFIISKIRATPTWVLLCCAIAFVSFAILFWLVEYKGKGKWFQMIKIAGTNTLTCYLVPYLVYNVVVLSGLRLPSFALTGGVGLIKSVIYTALVLMITAILNRFKIRLSI